MGMLGVSIVGLELSRTVLTNCSALFHLLFIIAPHVSA
jgi:hypothetical protein